MAHQKSIIGCFKWLGATVLTLLLLAVLLLLLIQTGPGKRLLSSFIETWVRSSTGVGLEIGHLTGWIPCDTRLDYLALSDDEGEWLRIDDIRVLLSPWDLVKGRFRFHEIAFAGAKISRNPIGVREEEPRPAAQRNGSITFPHLDIERFSVGTIMLEEAVAGQRAVLTLSGRYLNAGPEEGLLLLLNVRRTDQVALEVDLEAGYEAAEPQIRLFVKVREDEGGLFAGLLGLPPAGSLSVTLDGKGSGSRWSGRMKGTKGNRPLIDSDLDLSVDGEIALSGRGMIMAPWVVIPDGMEGTPDSAIHFGFAARYSTADQVARVDSLRLRQDSVGSIHVTGEYGLKNTAFVADAALESARTDILASFLGIGTIGRLTGEAHLSGTRMSPRGSLSFHAERVTDNRVRIEAIGFELRVAPVDTTGTTRAGIRLSGEGTAEGLRDGQGRPFPEERLRCDFSVDVQAGRPIEISKFTVSGDQATIDLSGSIDPSGPGTIEASIEVPAVEKLWPTLEKQLSGSVRARVSARGDISTGSITARIDGRVRPSHVTSVPLGELFGSEPRFTGDIRTDTFERLAITSMILEGEGIEFRGSGEVNLSEKNFRTTFRSALPDLSVLSVGTDGQFYGSIDLEGRLDGSFDNAAGRVDLSGKDIRLRGREIGDLEGRLDFRDLFGRMAGDIVLRLGKEPHRVDARTGFLIADGRLVLSDIALEGLRTRLSGNLHVDLETALVEGDIVGEAADLTELGQVLKEGLAGKAGMAVRLSAMSDRQRGRLTLNAEQIRSRFGAVENLGATVDLDDIRDNPSGSVSVSMVGLAAGELILSAVSFDATGDFRQAAYDGTAIGEFKGPLSLETRGRMERGEVGTRLEVEHLQGVLGEERVAILSPLVFESRPAGYNFQGLALGIGDGRLDADGTVNPDTVEISCNINKLPVSILSYLGVPNFQGSIGGAVHMDGKPAEPRVEASLQVTELKVRDPALEDLVPSTLALETRIRDSVLGAVMEVSQAGRRSVRGTVDVPLELSLLPLACSLSPEGKLDGRLEGDFDIERIAPFFMPVDQRISGLVNGDIRLTGTVSVPIVSGRLTFSDGSYENITSGTVLKGIETEAVAEGRRLEIQRFHATDGKKGIVSGTGWIDLDAGHDFPFEMRMEVLEAKLVHQDAITAVLDGRLIVSGTFVDASLTGSLAAKHADILIPEKLSSQIPTLNEIEVGDIGGVKPQAAEEEAPGQSRVGLDLTILLPGALFVRGRGLDSEWKGELKIAGEFSEPIINGNLSVVRGRFVFFDKRFVLNEGNISFFGAVPPDPNISVKAETRARDLTVHLLISGPSSNLDISLESVPPLPSDELLARLLFGRDLTSITPIQALQLAQAVSAISGGGGTLDFMSRTRRLLSLDELEVRQEEEGAGTSVGVGKYVSEDVFIKVERNLASEDSRVMVEVELTPSLNVESDVGTDSRRGVGLSWKHDY